MSLHQVPSKAEVSGWSPQQLADFLKKSKLLGCDKAVLRNSISGARFVNLSENDLQKFPKTYAPMISKLSTDISKKEEKRGLFGRFGAPKHHEPEAVPDGGGWGDDEFDEFDEDYESPCSAEEDCSDYESPIEDQDLDQDLNQHPNEDQDGDYELPPSEPPDDFSLKLPSRSFGDGDYIDSHVTSRGPPPVVCPRPPVSTPQNRRPTESCSRRDASPHCGPKPPGKPPLQPPPPQVFRGNKPRRDPAMNPSPVREANRNTAEKPQSLPRRPQQDVPQPQSWAKPPGLPPTSASVSRSNSSARPPPNRFESQREDTPDEALKGNTFPLQNKSPRPALSPARHSDSLPPSFSSGASFMHKPPSGNVPAPEKTSFRPPSTGFNTNKELDPVWYVGRVTRGQAEASLQRIRKDGAYVVRDSTKQSSGQPYTLMVFFQDKVYNIQIRQQNQSFLLGTGLKVQESFPSVRDIVVHYSQSPLLLIDAKNRDTGLQNQCLLSDPAGRHLQAQNWT